MTISAHGAGTRSTIVPRGRQSDVVYFEPTRNLVVLGTAGTGKSTMAVLRAAYLSHALTPNNGRVLLVTYNNALVRYLRHLVPGNLSNVTVQTYARFARGYLSSVGRMPPGWGQILDGSRLRRMISSAIANTRLIGGATPFLDSNVGFFIDELAWLAAMGLDTEVAYLDADRRGRGTALGPLQRKAVWQVRDEYLRLRAAAGVPFDWNDLASAVISEFETDTDARLYQHVVIDEGQDLSPEAIRSLVAAVPPNGTVSFFGDYHQQIYGQGLSWRACGLRVTSVQKFADNLRNTAQIARVAIAMSGMPHLSTSFPGDVVIPVEPAASGSLPTLLACRDEAEEIAEIQRVARDQAAAGTVAILARSWHEAASAVAGLGDARLLKEDSDQPWDPSPGIYYGTYHSAKGLEFDVVILPFSSSHHLPNPETVEAYGPADASTRDGKLLYVAVTRAKAELLVTYSGQASALLPRASGLWLERSP